MKIEALCINDKNKPNIIPNSLWIKEGEKYHITWIYKMVNQEGIQGCLIAEKDISAYIPYNCFKLSRFAFKQEDLDKLRQLILDCTQFSEINVDKFLEECLLVSEN